MISGDTVQLKVVIKNVYFHLFNFYFACTNVLRSISVNQHIKFFRVKILKIMSLCEWLFLLQNYPDGGDRKPMPTCKR